MSRALFRHAAALAMGLGLAGCGSSPPVQYYTLARTAGATATGPAAMLVEVLPVDLPERLNRDEIVLTGAGGRLSVQSSEHWAAPLSDEIGRVVDAALWRRLKAVNVYNAPVAPTAGGPRQYRLALRVERFQAGPDAVATVGASWTVRRLPQGQSVTCRAETQVRLPVLSTAAAADGLAETTASLAAMVADSLARMDGGTDTVCPSSSGGRG